MIACAVNVNELLCKPLSECRSVRPDFQFEIFPEHISARHPALYTRIVRLIHPALYTRIARLIHPALYTRIARLIHPALYTRIIRLKIPRIVFVVRRKTLDPPTETLGAPNENHYHLHPTKEMIVTSECKPLSFTRVDENHYHYQPGE